MRYFFRLFPFPAFPSSSAGTPISPTLQSTLCLKAGAKICNAFYYPNLYTSFFNNIFIFFVIVLYMPVI
jgi:hypothetical protein